MTKLKKRSVRAGAITAKAPEPEGNDSTIAFSFGKLSSNSEYDNCTDEDKAAITDALFKRKDLSWVQIVLKPRHGLGAEQISARAIKRAIPEDMKSREYFHAIRYKGNAPLVGFCSAGIFYIVWIDRNFTLYAH